MFQCKSKNVAIKWTQAVMVGPTIIHHSGYLLISKEMHCQETQFGRQEGNLYYNGW